MYLLVTWQWTCQIAEKTKSTSKRENEPMTVIWHEADIITLTLKDQNSSIKINSQYIIKIQSWKYVYNGVF